MPRSKSPAPKRQKLLDVECSEIQYQRIVASHQNVVDRDEFDELNIVRTGARAAAYYSKQATILKTLLDHSGNDFFIIQSYSYGRSDRVGGNHAVVFAKLQTSYFYFDSSYGCSPGTDTANINHLLDDACWAGAMTNVSMGRCWNVNDASCKAFAVYFILLSLTYSTRAIEIMDEQFGDYSVLSLTSLRCYYNLIDPRQLRKELTRYMTNRLKTFLKTYPKNNSDGLFYELCVADTPFEDAIALVRKDVSETIPVLFPAVQRGECLKMSSVHRR